jgi:DNA-binding protein HU-beta
VNKAELIEAVASRLDGSKKAAGEAVEAVFDEIIRAVASGEKVAITGFGNFEKSDRAARTGRNPRTGEAVKIKATSVPKFRAGAEFKAVVSGKKKAASAKKSAKKAAPAKKSAKKAAPAKKSAKKAAPAKKSTKRTAAKKTTKKATKRR